MGRPRTGLLLALLLLGCDPSTDVGQAEEHLPAIGYLHVEGDPIVADHPLVAGFIVDGQRSQVTFRFDPGDSIVFDHTTPANTDQWVTVDGRQCANPYNLRTEMETDVTLRLTTDGCSLETDRTHAPGVVAHPEGQPEVVAP